MLESCAVPPTSKLSDMKQIQRPVLRLAAACLCGLVLGIGQFALAQSAGTEAISAAGAASVLNVVRWTGSLPEAAGHTVEARFALYQDQAGGLALWSETQPVKVGADGRFSVLLGATSAEGLPQNLFQGSAAKWIEARVAGSSPSPAAARSPLAAVPYAFKSVDAESLAGRAATDYVTRDELQSAVAGGVLAAAQLAPQATVGGAGTANYVPLWTGAATMGNSVITQSGAKIGIGFATPATTLDVGGPTTMRGTLNLHGYSATAATGVNSPPLLFGASAYSTTAKAAVAQTFQWQAVSAGNNTAAPTANFQLLFGAGAAAPAATGLSIAPTGVITFAPGQSFPSAATIFPKGATFDAESFITGSSTDWMLVATNNSATSKGSILGQATNKGNGVAGTSPGGIGVVGETDTGIGVEAYSDATGDALDALSYGTGLAANLWSQNPGGPAVRVVNATAGNGLIASSNGGLALSGSTTGGSGVYALSTTTGSGVTAVANTGFAGNFSNISTNNPTLQATNGGAGNAGAFLNNSAGHVTMAAENSSADPNAVAAYGSVANGKAVYGVSTSGIGVYGTTSGGAGTIGVYGTGSTGVLGVATGGSGVNGSATSGVGVTASSISGNGVYATSTSGVATGRFQQGALLSDTGQVALGRHTAVWGDTSTDDLNGGAAIIGTADNANAGYFENNSGSFGASTIRAINNGKGDTINIAGPRGNLQQQRDWGSVNVFVGAGGGGVCAMAGDGGLSCTGQLKALVDAAGGSRKVETYAMQSPENWIEDFGSGTLQRGVGLVTIDPDFAETVAADAGYHVFLTPNGDSKGLYVIRKTATSFEVRESGGGTSSLSFDYRIVGKRRGFEAQRLTDVTERFNAETRAVNRPIPAAKP